MGCGSLSKRLSDWLNVDPRSTDTYPRTVDIETGGWKYSALTPWSGTREQNYLPNIDRAKGTKLLNLSGYDLNAVPEIVSTMTLLRSIDLSCNSLTNFALPAMKKLKVLNLSNNGITTLADCFSPMVRLETVNLENNKLTVVPPSIWASSRLKTVNLSHNSVNILESYGLSGSRVETLDLSYNRLGNVPLDILKLKYLEDLNLACNQLTFLPEDWSDAKRLMVLDLSGNRIEKIGPSLFVDTQLFRINLFNNPCYPDRWRLFDGFDEYVKRYKSHVDKGLFHGGKVDYNQFI